MNTAAVAVAVNVAAIPESKFAIRSTPSLTITSVASQS